MPDGFQTEFERQLTEWERKLYRFTSQRESMRSTLEALGKKREQIATRGAPEWLQQFERSTGGKLLKAAQMPTMWPATALETFLTGLRLRAITPELGAAQDAFSKNLFYEDVYSTIPALVASQAANSVDEALNMIAVPKDLPEAELKQVRNEISALLRARDARVPVAPLAPELGEAAPKAGITAEGLKYPELTPPTAVTPVRGGRIDLMRFTIQDILKSLKASAVPKTPQTGMTAEEWNEYLRSQGWSEEDVDEQLRIQTEKLVAEAQNRKNLVEAYRNETVKMPEMTLIDTLKMAIVTPPLVILEGLNIYYEHVSMPAAGWLYGQIPDIQRAYQDFKKSNPDATEREARVYAWKQWEAPGPPVLDFILKYMIMEGLVDPVSYVGWGYISKGLRALGPAGRLLARGNAAVGHVLEAPFDFAKYFAGKVIPKTIAQEAAVMSRESQAILGKYLELYTKTPVHSVAPKNMYKAGEEALAHLVKNPRAEDDVALAARELLAHPPIGKTDVIRWAERLKGTGASTIAPSEITDKMAFELTDLYERVFNKEITVDEAAPFILQKLGATGVTEETSVVAGRILADRANQIYSRALDFATEETTIKALRAYERKTLRIYEATAASDALKEAHRAGRFQLFWYGIDKRFISPWLTTLNRYVIRTAADAYLVFGAYGPFNTGEDIWRSVLGGVKPGRMTRERYELLTLGLKRDPEILRPGMSEMIGPTAEVGEPVRSNWILTLGELPLSIPVFLASKGKVSPAEFAGKTQELMLRRFSGFQAEIRRNFSGGRYTQVLSDLGGDAFKALDDVVGKPPSLPQSLKWVRKNLEKDLHAAATSGKLTSNNAELIKLIKNRYTRDKILQTEVDEVLKRYPEISPSSRSEIARKMRQKTLLESPDMIDEAMKDVLAVEVDDFLRRPERVTADFAGLVEYFTALEVKSPEDMAELIFALHKMTTTYGVLPDQILAIATIKSRVLPVA